MGKVISFSRKKTDRIIIGQRLRRHVKYIVGGPLPVNKLALEVFGLDSKKKKAD